MALLRASLWFAIGLAELGGTRALAQSIEPRTYSPAPVGTNFAIIAYSEAHGAIPMDPALPLSDIDLKVRGTAIAYSHAFNLLGKSAKFDVAVPFGKLSGNATFFGQPVERDVSGFEDPLARLTILFHGAPAMSLEQFNAYRPDLIVGASVQVSIPIGQYEKDKLLNLGSNRWSIKPELGASKSWGRWTLETAAGATFFGANDQFLGSHKRSQKPIYSAQGHVIYNFGPGVWVAGNLSWFGGGRTTIDGLRQQGLHKNWRVGLILAVPLSRRLSVKANASTGVFAHTGSNFDLYGIALQYVWGAGI